MSVRPRQNLPGSLLLRPVAYLFGALAIVLALTSYLTAWPLTSILIFINKKYGIVGSGVEITGEPSKDA